MARPKAYDDDTVLSAAMHVFRRRGYAGASIRDLEQATGLKSGSIYNGFGDKDGLFRAALAHYNTAVVRRRIDRFLPDGAGLDGLRHLFRSLLSEPDGGANGCLLTNSAIEFGAGDPIAAPGVQEGLGLLEAAFTRAIAQAAIPCSALHLLAFYQGILVLVRSGRAPADLAVLIDAEFDRLAGGGDDA
jgi:AcrR family transcriptional regulator